MTKNLPHTVYQADTWPYLTQQTREEITAWLLAHGIEPRRLPLSENVVIKDGKVRYWAMSIEKSEGNVMKVKAGLNAEGERCIVVEEETVEWNRTLPETP